MNSRMLMMGLAAVSMIGLSVEAQACDSCEAAGTGMQTAAVPAQNAGMCEICFSRPGELFGGLKKLAVCRTCVPCSAETAAEVAVPEENDVAPIKTPDDAFCTACAAKSAESANSNDAVPAASCASCAAPEIGNVLPIQRAPLRESVRGVRCMISGLFGAMTEAVMTPPPCSPFVQTGNCTSCGVNNEAVTTTINTDLSETTGTEQVGLPESPKVEE